MKFNDGSSNSKWFTGTGAGTAADPFIPETYPNAAGVPSSFNRTMSVSDTVPLTPGVLAKLRLRPAILNEHAESSREVIGVVDTATAVGQMFLPSSGDINTIFVTLESAEAETVVDAIEYSGNDGNLQAAWILVGTNEAVTEAAIVSGNDGSTESMELDLSILNDSWTFTKASTSWDMTGATIDFDYYQSVVSTQGTVTLSIDDGANTSVITLAVPAALVNTWEHFDIPVDSFTGTADVSAITNVFFTVTNSQNNRAAYVDNVSFRPAPGSISLELWDMGSSLPANDGTVDYTASGTQYTELGDRGISGTVAASIMLDLRGGKQLYHIQDFVAGAAPEITSNTLLTVGNYYAIVLKYIDTDVSVYGPDTTLSTNYYTNGYAWKAEVADGLIDLLPGAAGAGAYSDLMFGIMSTQDVYVTKMTVKLFDSSSDPTPSAIDTQTTFLVENASMVMEVVMITHFLQSEHEEDLASKPIFMEMGGKAEIYYSSSVNDPAVIAVYDVEYLYEPPSANG